MYNVFFEFEQTPFAVRPDLGFFFRGEQHDAALRSLSFAVQARMGLSSLTGEQGTGKTMVLECLRDSLEAVQIQCAFLRDSRTSVNRLFQSIASELELPCQGTSADHVSSALHQFTISQAKKGRTVALIVDEAHNLPADVLNEILQLTSWQDNKAKLLQTVLAGNPELNLTLDAVNLAPLKQSSILSCALEPFSARETQDYIEFRLAQAGMPEQTVFPPEVISEIYERSQGFAPSIHALCEGLLRTAFSAESKVCTPEILDQFFNPPSGESSAEIPIGVGATSIDLSRLALLSEPEDPAIQLALLRLVFDILPRPFAVKSNNLSEPQQSVLRPLLPTCGSSLPGAELAVGSNKLMRLADGARTGSKRKRQRAAQNKAALLSPSSPNLAEPVDFPSIALRPSHSVVEYLTASAALLAPKGVTRFVPLAQTVQPTSGICNHVVSEAISLEGSAAFIHPVARFQPAGTLKQHGLPLIPFGIAKQDPPSPRLDAEVHTPAVNLENLIQPSIARQLAAGPSVRSQSSLVPLVCSLSAIPLPAGTAVKPRLTPLQSLQPWGPESNLQPVTPRKHSLLQPAWTPLEKTPAEAQFAANGRSFSLNRKWLSAFAVTIVAGLALYGGSPALGTAVDAVSHGWQRAHEAVADRAAVVLDEDFRTGLDNWTNRGSGHPAWTSDEAGFVHPTALALYRPSIGLVDYQMQFVGTIDKKSLNWAVRAADFNNYYAIGLTVLKPGPMPAIGVTRYAVVNGKIQNRVTTPLTISARLDTVYHVSLDVHGDDFALSVQDQLVDSWSESNLRHGGIGFFAEPDTGSRVAGLQVRGQYDMLGRLCAFLIPSGGSSYRASVNERAAITE